MTILSTDLAAHRLAEPVTEPRIGLDHPGTDCSVIQADGAYRTEVLRVVRGTPNPEELAALVAALLLTRRAHEENLSRAPQAAQHRPAWPREHYTAPGSWAAGP